MKLAESLIVAAVAVVAIGLSALPAAATTVVLPDPVAVPEPGTLSTLAGTVVAGIIGYRFIRRR
jgi:hypothetical protein